MNADALIERARRRHGGEEGRAWLAADVTIHVEHLGGMIPKRKGLGATHPKPGVVTVWPFEARMTFHDYPEQGAGLVYDRGTIVRGDERLENYRRRFDGWAKKRKWSPEDAAYFFGYAVTDYLALPFALAGLPIHGSGTRPYRGQRVHYVDALHPGGGDTHNSGRQSYYFDESGLLVRHDYRADVLGRLFTGAHDSGEYDESHPAPIARSRIVRARLGRTMLPIKVLEARFRVIEGRS